VVFIRLERTGQARTVLFSGAGDLRYLLVLLPLTTTPTPWAQPAATGEAQLIAWLGHELQHALEIAQAPWVRTAEDVHKLFRQIGRQSGRNQYETDEAKAVERAIHKELRRR
jgi:hypothetical protein